MHLYQLYHKFPSFVKLFYVDTTRRRCGKVTTHATGLSQHESLKDAHVHEITMCVTSGAFRAGSNFGVLRRCSEYVTIYNTSGTCVRQITLYVTSGARRRSLPLGFSPRGLATSNLGRQGRPRFRNNSGWWPFGLPKSPGDAFRTFLWHARGYTLTSGLVSCSCGCAMHMEWPDGIGREARLGNTRNVKELSVSLACP